MQTEYWGLPTLRPSQLTWALSPPLPSATVVGCCHLHHRHLLLLLSSEDDAHFTVPHRVEVWVNPGHAVHAQCGKHNFPVWNLIPGSLIPQTQTDMLPLSIPQTEYFLLKFPITVFMLFARHYDIKTCCCASHCGCKIRPDIIQCI